MCDNVCGGMKKLTLRQALIATRNIWDWLARHPEKDKLGLPKRFKAWEYQNHCPCCEYVEQHDDLDAPKSCGLCPLIGLWPEGCCSSHSSPYYQWEESVGQERSRHAKRIADACRRELKRL